MPDERALFHPASIIISFTGNCFRLSLNPEQFRFCISIGNAFNPVFVETVYRAIVPPVRKLHADHKGPKHPGCNGRSDHSGRVARHCVHQKIVGRILSLPHQVHLSSRSGNRGNTRCPEQRIDLFFGKKIHDFSENNAGRRSKAEGQSP